MTEVFYAQWSREKSEEMVVVDQDGEVVTSFPVRPTGERPVPDMLLSNGWAAFPGTEWAEEPPGQWSRPVHPQPQNGGTGIRSNDRDLSSRTPGRFRSLHTE